MIQDGQNSEGAPLRDGLPVQAPSPDGLGHSAGIPDAVAEFIDMLEHGYFPFIEGRLSDAMCCDGRMCGCRGASVGEYLAHHLKEALGLPTKAIEARSDKTVTGLAVGESAAPQGFAQTQSGAD